MTPPLLTNLDALWVYEAMKTRSQGARCVTHPAQQEPQPHKLSSNKIASSQLGDDDHLVLSCKQRKTAAAAEAAKVRRSVKKEEKKAITKKKAAALQEGAVVKLVTDEEVETDPELDGLSDPPERLT